MATRTGGGGHDDDVDGGALQDIHETGDVAQSEVGDVAQGEVGDVAQGEDGDAAQLQDTANDGHPELVENTDTLCSDDIDNDDDSYTDCADFDCSRNPDVTVCEGDAENTDALCVDDIDNDLNGFTDCEDWGCSLNPGVTVCEAETPENTDAACLDGIDNDDDGDTDCLDWDCLGNPDVTVCCQPNCAGRECGSDGCGSDCGNCPDGLTCDAGLCFGDCIPGAERCVAGDIVAVERCSATGLWEATTCGDWQLCSRNACRTVCDVPNEDGVNDGIYYYTNDVDRLGGCCAGAVVENWPGREANILLADADDREFYLEWPYQWELNWSGETRLAEVQFRLDQFEPGLREVSLLYRARRQDPVLGDSYLTYLEQHAYAEGVGVFMIN